MMNSLQPLNAVFVVDDDHITQITIKSLFKKHGLAEKITSFFNGEEALNAFKVLDSHNAVWPELVLLDLNMPIMDGWEFLSAFSSFNWESKTNIVVCTSSIDPEDESRIRKLGKILDYINKPLTISKLETVLNKLYTTT